MSAADRTVADNFATNHNTLSVILEHLASLEALVIQEHRGDLQEPLDVDKQEPRLL